MPRLVSAVAFDQFVLDERGLARPDGSTLVRGTSTGGTSIAVGAVPWPDMPIDWVALQSRLGPDLLALVGDEMTAVGHRRFDERFAVDADDVSGFRKQFRTSLREWLVDFDDAHGPLVVIFDGAADDEPATPRRRSTDEPAASDPAPDPATAPTVFVARVLDDDAQIVPTLDVAAELTAHVRTAFEH